MQSPASPPDPQWTILKTLQWTTSFFKSHHIDSPRLTAEILLAHVLEIRRIDLYLRFDQPLTPAELGGYKTLIKRRASREPVAYITGYREFWGLDFAVTGDVLIPRPETEFLVEEAMKQLPEESSSGGLRVLDIGTGSGAVVVALAYHRPAHRYFASDISQKAMAVAVKNALRHKASDRIGFFVGDLMDALNFRGPGFDLIVSNPPYVAADAIKGLAPEVARFEPLAALDGGPGGLEIVRTIILQAPAVLKKNGTLMLEIGFDQKEGVDKIVSDAGEYEDLRFVQDYGGHHRVAVLRRR